MGWFKKLLWAVFLGFAMECLVNAVDVSISRTGDKVEVFTTNNTYRCAIFQWNTTLATNGWNDYHGYFAGAMDQPVKHISFSVTANSNQVFWRIRDCAVP